MKTRSAANRFTLIELLIVIAIIAILAAMLLPALNNAREVGKKIKCLANFKQLGSSVTMYLDDSQEFYPYKVATPDSGSYSWQNTYRLYGWPKRLLPYTSGFHVDYCPKDLSWNSGYPKTITDSRMSWYPASYQWRYPLAEAAEATGKLNRGLKAVDLRFSSRQVVLNEFRSWHFRLNQLLGPNGSPKLSNFIESNALWGDGHAGTWTLTVYNGTGYWETGFTVSTQTGSQWWDPRTRHD